MRIRGLTDDWPELTTYFDAEIIGSRHGFLTQNWGANEQEDMVHWQRFPAFRHVKHELKKPHLTMNDRDRGAVFMRWKERFLVPDHRVQDINGASFAGQLLSPLRTTYAMARKKSQCIKDIAQQHRYCRRYGIVCDRFLCPKDISKAALSVHSVHTSRRLYHAVHVT